MAEVQIPSDVKLYSTISCPSAWNKALMCVCNSLSHDALRQAHLDADPKYPSLGQLIVSAAVRRRVERVERVAFRSLIIAVGTPIAFVFLLCNRWLVSTDVRLFLLYNVALLLLCVRIKLSY